jgi:hypothetical protein
MISKAPLNIEVFNEQRKCFGSIIKLKTKFYVYFSKVEWTSIYIKRQLTKPSANQEFH